MKRRWLLQCFHSHAFGEIQDIDLCITSSRCVSQGDSTLAVAKKNALEHLQLMHSSSAKVMVIYLASFYAQDMCLRPSCRTVTRMSRSRDGHDLQSLIRQDGDRFPSRESMARLYFTPHRPTSCKVANLSQGNGDPRPTLLYKENSGHDRSL